MRAWNRSRAVNEDPVNCRRSDPRGKYTPACSKVMERYATTAHVGCQQLPLDVLSISGFNRPAMGQETKTRCVKRAVYGQPSWRIASSEVEAFITEMGGHVSDDCHCDAAYGVPWRTIWLRR